MDTVAADLTARGNLAGGEAQAVLEAQALIAQDPELMAEVERRIAGGSCAERAVFDAFATYRVLLASHLQTHPGHSPLARGLMAPLPGRPALPAAATCPM